MIAGIVAAVFALLAMAVSPAIAGPCQSATPVQDSANSGASNLEQAASEPHGSVNSDEGSEEEPRRQLKSWNEYESPWFTVRLGAGFLYDVADYSQDSDSKSQFDFDSDEYVRDSRLLLKGKLKFLPRTRYTIGYMYDSDVDDWFWRQTGLYFDLPEIGGDIFVGRVKEGFSMNKMMVGYNGWTHERATANDAFIPILADGVQIRGSVESLGIAWNVGAYDDFWTDKEGFNRNNNVVVVRGVYQPLHDRPADDILHLGVAYRYGDDNDGQLLYKSRPESFSAPFVIDTGAFDADYSQTVGLETYWRSGSLFAGGEYFLNTNDASGASDPFFHGGEAVITWLTGGNVRPYNPKTGVFGGIVPPTSVFCGGKGTWEFVARVSYTDLEDGPINGGKFWRLTPMVNWHMSNNVRLELIYGFGELDRFGTEGGTQFFQSRIQLQI